jgi:hypothetical protein
MGGARLRAIPIIPPPTAASDGYRFPLHPSYPAGGASDVTAPIVAERLNQTVIIDNRAGANGALGRPS